MIIIDLNYNLTKINDEKQDKNDFTCVGLANSSSRNCHSWIWPAVDELLSSRIELTEWSRPFELCWLNKQLLIVAADVWVAAVQCRTGGGGLHTAFVTVIELVSANERGIRESRSVYKKSKKIRAFFIATI